ncbi:hypothetical protein I6N96_01055 [Enterococcus sp. BWM-S5]|uniref:Phage protein n=1 Tax=Enterococcus larvae TaxID=2794352 RepID=A0ABS4CE37_9ENTE|nr:hypothetical protein [Enterococcus larvae]MBP1044850.1 hypothetical protein [Enterococcus larvae]
MKYVVLKEFKDKKTSEIYAVGQEINFTAKRAAEAEDNLQVFGGDFFEKVKDEKITLEK